MIVQAVQVWSSGGTGSISWLVCSVSQTGQIRLSASLTQTWSGAMALATLGSSQARIDVARAFTVSLEMRGDASALILIFAPFSRSRWTRAGALATEVKGAPM